MLACANTSKMALIQISTKLLKMKQTVNANCNLTNAEKIWVYFIL